MTYDEFVKKAPELGIKLEEALQKVFFEIDDDFSYDTSEAGEVVGKSVDTIKRWCRDGKLKYEKKNPYEILGIELKRCLFRIFWPDIQRRYGGLF